MVALDGTYRTSTRSGDNGACVDVCYNQDLSAVQVRHSKHTRNGDTVLLFSRNEWLRLCSEPRTYFRRTSAGWILEQGGKSIAYTSREVDAFVDGVVDAEFELPIAV